MLSVNIMRFPPFNTLESPAATRMQWSFTPAACPPLRSYCQIVVKARSKYINVADKMCEFNDCFMLYMTTRLPNPHLSPENQAKVTVVVFKK